MAARRGSPAWPSIEQCRRSVCARLGLARKPGIGVGVDRLDYTKGILERMLAVERLLEQHPEWIGRFTFVQVAAPTRGALEEYRQFQDRICAWPNGSPRFGDGERPSDPPAGRATTSADAVTSCIAPPTHAW